MEIYLAPIIIAVSLLLVFGYTVLQASRFEYKCTFCKKQFRANPVVAALAPQSKGKKYLMCPSCRTKQFCQLIYKGK
ncbi:MAG: hypothetical protein RR253_00330 [Oscillospiraceae bacterium]